MPSVVRGNTNDAVIAIAEKATDCSRTDPPRHRDRTHPRGKPPPSLNFALTGGPKHYGDLTNFSIDSARNLCVPKTSSVLMR